MRDIPWWKSGILYQVYPRSFQDSNGDGVGDLRGIIDRLTYLRDLGVNAVWLSPIFPSPMVDFGYDISDYTGIDSLFGTLQDFDALVTAAHELGLKIILDLVPNHTSDQHPWFVESRSSRSNPKRDWYIWRDGRTGAEPPNNWISEFGGSSWEFDATTGQYYYHAFLKVQPDLNWRNPDVRQAIYEVMRFWLRRGVDGFRVDVMWHLIKDDLLRDNPPNPDFVDGDQPYTRLLPLYSTDRPEVHDVIAEMRRVMDEFDDRVLIGEIYLAPTKLVAYYGRDLSGAHLPFNFALISTPGRRGQLRSSLRLTKQLCQWAAGRIGCWEITIAGVSLAASDAIKPVSQQCCFLRSAAHPRSITAMKSAWSRSIFRRIGCGILLKRTCPGLVWDAMVAGRQCNGMLHRAAASATLNHGCH